MKNTKAIEKFEKATDLKPDDHQAFNNWRTALVRLGVSKEGEKKNVTITKPLKNTKKPLIAVEVHIIFRVSMRFKVLQKTH